MDSNFYPFTPHGAFNPYDQTLEFISEDFSTDDHRHTLSSRPTLSTIDTQLPETPQRKPSRPSRPKSLSTDQIKHRRTRSGCFTCRSRRVKCDETRPICERCRKGKRDCTYPDKTTAKSKGSNAKSSSPTTVDSPSGSSSDDIAAETVTSGISSVLDGGDTPSTATTSALPFSRTDSKRSHITGEDGLSMLEPQSPSLMTLPDQKSPFPLESIPSWSSLPKDAQFYLEYHRDHIAFCHYAFKHDCREFLKTDFLEIASNYEPLLYAIIAFSAYHYTLRQPGGRAKRFLEYYDRAVSLFRQSLFKGYRHPLATILTMLQLATIEEFLGDWVNLLGHQRAARHMITQMHTPEQMASESFTHRVILVWYWRFDLFAGIMSGGSPQLGREWFKACVDYCEIQAREHPTDLGNIFDHFFTTSRMLATDSTILFEKRKKGAITNEKFNSSYKELRDKTFSLRHKVETAFRDVPYFTKHWRREPGEDTLTDFNDPHFMFNGPYFTMNYILIDLWGANLVFLHYVAEMEAENAQSARIAKTPEMTEIALKKCKMLEAIEYCDETPPGAVLCCQASLSIASLFVPNEKKYHDWARRKFALLESNGYIYPPTLRKRMGDIWEADVSDWWLPNGEGFPPMIRTVREFINFRTSQASTLDDRDVNVRDLNGIFHQMQLAGRKDLLQRLGAEDQMILDVP